MPMSAPLRSSQASSMPKSQALIPLREVELTKLRSPPLRAKNSSFCSLPPVSLLAPGATASPEASVVPVHSAALPPTRQMETSQPATGLPLASEVTQTREVRGECLAVMARSVMRTRVRSMLWSDPRRPLSCVSSSMASRPRGLPSSFLRFLRTVTLRLGRMATLSFSFLAPARSSSSVFSLSQ